MPSYIFEHCHEAKFQNLKNTNKETDSQIPTFPTSLFLVLSQTISTHPNLQVTVCGRKRCSAFKFTLGHTCTTVGEATSQS